MDAKVKALLAASVVGLLAAASAGTAQAHEGEAQAGATAKDVPCYGVNKCKGVGDCGGKSSDGTTHACAGKNACKGQGYIEMQEDDCTRIQNGSLTPPAGA